MISKSQISYIKSLHQKKFRKEYQQFIVEGDKLCDEFISSNYHVKQIYLLDTKREKYELLLLKLSKKIEIVVVKADDMERISNLSTPSEVLLIVDFPKEDIQTQVTKEQLHNKLTLMLDGVKDPGNLGTIIRIADWFGIENIICSEDCVELYNPKVVQSTMGSILRVNLIYTDLKKYLGELNEIEVFGALLEGENIYTMKSEWKGILLMGSESHGISKELLPLITKPITIPSFGNAESLNVAIATGILCSEARRDDF